MKTNKNLITVLAKNFSTKLNANVNLQNRIGKSFLHQEAENRYSAKKDKENVTENFLNAAERGDVDQIRNLIEKGANVNVKQDNDSGTALHIAAEKGYIGIIRALIEGRANVNARNKAGLTASFAYIS